MSHKYSNFDEERAKLNKEIQRICKKFKIDPQILNAVSRINLDNYIPLCEMLKGSDKNQEGFDRIEYWHDCDSLIKYNFKCHDVMFTYSNN